jgi:hypothetical protein
MIEKKQAHLEFLFKTEISRQQSRASNYGRGILLFVDLII